MTSQGVTRGKAHPRGTATSMAMNAITAFGEFDPDRRRSRTAGSIVSRR
jgi:hypothetical protein